MWSWESQRIWNYRLRFKQNADADANADAGDDADADAGDDDDADDDAYEDLTLNRSGPQSDGQPTVRSLGRQKNSSWTYKLCDDDDDNDDGDDDMVIMMIIDDTGL